MDDQRLGTAVRAVRHRRGWRQGDLAARSEVSASLISRLERGHLDTLAVKTLRRVLGCLDMRLDLVPRWRAGDLDRLLARQHAALADAVVAGLSARGWAVRPEVTFSIWGERGSIDLLAYHRATNAVLVVEVKSDLVDPHGLIAQVDRYRRLAPQIVAPLGWSPRGFSAWVVIAEGRANRRRLASHRSLLRAAFPADGRVMSTWLRDPAVPVAGLSFLSVPNPAAAGSRQRVRAPTRTVRPDEI